MKHKIKADHAHELWSILDALKDHLAKNGVKIVKVKIRIVTAGMFMGSKADVWDNAESTYINIRDIGCVSMPGEQQKKNAETFAETVRLTGV